MFQYFYSIYQGWTTYVCMHQHCAHIISKFLCLFLYGASPALHVRPQLFVVPYKTCLLCKCSAATLISKEHQLSISRGPYLVQTSRTALIIKIISKLPNTLFFTNISQLKLFQLPYYSDQHNINCDAILLNDESSQIFKLSELSNSNSFFKFFRFFFN